MILTGIGKENAKAFVELLLGSGLKKDCLAVGVIEDDKPVAAAVFSEDEHRVIRLEHLYVVPEYRRRGIAEKLMKESLRAFGPGAFMAVFSEDTEGMKPFLAHMGCGMVSGLRIYGAKLSVLRERASATSLFSGKKKYSVIPLKELPAIEKKQLRKKLAEAGLGDASLDDGQADGDLSLILADPEDKELRAALMCEKQEDTILLRLLANFCKDPKAMTELLAAFLEASEGMDEFTVRFLPAVESVLSFAKKLAGDALTDEGGMMTAIGVIKEI